MMGLQSKICMAFLVAIAACSSTAQAALIDSFDDRGIVLYVIPGAGTHSAGEAVGGAIGGYRNVSLTHTGGTGIALLYTNVANNAKFSFDQGVNTSAKATIAWDGGFENPSFEVDLTNAGTSNAIEVLVAGSDNVFDLKFTLYSGADDASTAMLSVPVTASPTAYVLPFADLVAESGAGADLAKVSAIRMEVTGGPAGDISIDNIQTVPEPGTLALGLAGALGIAIVALRRKAA
ncbi:MAG: PEP-CTERM sorting domain-containing protein [Planctomycetota bacterium]